MKKTALVLLSLGAVILVGVAFAALKRSAPSAPSAKRAAPNDGAQPASTSTPGPARFAIPIGDDPVLGPADALVTLVELGDFQCMHTRAAAPLVKRLLAEHPHDLRLIWKDAPLPLHRQAIPAAALARAATSKLGAAGFWQAHDKLFSVTGPLTSDALFRIASELGFEGPEAMQLIAHPPLDAALTAGLGLARALNATSTPQFFVNGRPLRGAVSYEALKRLIEEELASARAMVQAGVPRERVHAQLMAKAEVVREPTGPAPRIDRERKRASDERRELIEAMGRSEAFKIDDATLAKLEARGMSKEDLYEHTIQRTRVRWTLEAEGVVPPGRAAQPRHGLKPQPQPEVTPKAPAQ